MALKPNRSWKRLIRSVIIDIICQPQFIYNKKNKTKTRKVNDSTNGISRMLALETGLVTRELVLSTKNLS